MKNALSEIKKLGKAKPRKQKEIDPKDYLNLVMLYCYSIMQEEGNFEQFCEQENISRDLAQKVQDFSKTDSFLHYIFNPIFAIATNPSYNLQIPTRDKAKDESEKFALVILRDLVKDLETQSVESVCARADGTMQNFQEMTQAKMSSDIGQIFEGISM